MSDKTPSKDEALEALDFIVNVLKEHEKDLDKLVNELATVADQMGESGELNDKVKKIEDKISGLQENLSSMVNSLSSTQKESSAEHDLKREILTSKEEPKADTAKPSVASESLPGGLPLLLNCKQWEDFQALAVQAQTVTFAFKDTEKTFDVDALKNNQVITYSGERPNLCALLKMFLSKQLAVPEKQILEGDMTLG